jgi:hypothetical protein
MAEPAGDQADAQGEARGPHERRGGQHTHLEGIEAERQQIGRQQDADIAVGQRPQAARQDQSPGIGIRRRRKEPHQAAMQTNARADHSSNNRTFPPAAFQA